MSKLIMPAGILAVALAVLGAPVAYAQSWHALALLLLTLPGAAAAVLALDVRRRVRAQAHRMRRWQQDLDRRLAEVQQRPARADVVTQEDLVGAVRVIQARYEGRLDRAQVSLDEAVGMLRAQLGASATAASNADPDEVNPKE